MNKNDERFQKRLTVYQILATAGVAVGAVIMSLGVSSLGLSSDLAIASTGFDNDTDKQVKTYVAEAITDSRERGDILIKLGAGVVLGFVGIVALIVYTEKSTMKKIRSISKYPILFDEMYDSKEIELKKYDYDAYSVKKLRLEGEHLQSDFSILKYVEKNKMILITEDPENYDGCQENGLLCIKLGQNPSIDEIIKELKNLMKN